MRRREARRRDERGAVVIIVSAFLAVLLVSAAFVVDLGFNRVARADVQALADVVALDLARSIDGRTVDELTPELDQAAARSLARNSDVLGSAEPDLTYRLGTLSAGRFAPMTTGVPTAVRVTAHTTVDHAFSGVTGSEGGAATRSAVAVSSSTACFRLGTFVAAVRSGDSTVLAPLNDLLGVNLDLVSYRGLANADLRLAQIAAESVIGSPERLLSADIQYADLLRAMASGRAKEDPGANAVAIQALGRLASSGTAATVGTVNLAEVLHVAPTDRAALEVALSVLDLVGNARLAEGRYFLGVPNIQAQVPGVGFQFTGALALVSAAELACGAPNTPAAVADTAQLDGVLGITFTNLPSMNLAGLGTLQTPKGTGSLEITAGNGTGALVSPPAVRCGARTAADPSTFGVDVATGLASYRLTTSLSVGGEVKLTDLLGLGLTSVITQLLGNILTLGNKLAVEVEVALVIGTTRAASHTPVAVSMPPNDQTPVSTGGSVHLDPASVVPTVTAVRIGGRSAPLAQVTAITSLVVDELVNAAGGFVRKSLTPLIDNINSSFVGPVARMIGLRLAGADVYGVGVTCGQPRLVG